MTDLNKWFTSVSSVQNNSPKEEIPTVDFPGPKLVYCPQTALEAFNIMFPSTLVAHIVAETVRYARTQDESFTLSAETFLLWLASLILAGIDQRPSWKDYFTINPLLPQPIIFQLFSRKAWLDIWGYLHLDNDATYVPTNTGADHLKKFRTMYQILQNTFKTVWNPGAVVVVDEGMIPYRGKCPIRQFVPRKPDNTGIKYFAMVDNYGFLCHFTIYCGKTEDSPETGLATSVVDTMINQLQSPRLIVFDSYYNGVDTCDMLLETSHCFIGTTRKDRPSVLFDFLTTETSWASIANKSERKGMHTFIYNPEKRLTALVWEDTKTVYYLANFGNPTKMEDKVKTYTTWNADGQPNRVLVTKKIPQISSLYRRFYHQVDVFDRNHSTYRPRHRVLKWYKAVFISFVAFCTTNAWTFFKVRNSQKCTLKEFLLQLVEEIYNKYKNTK